MALLAAIFITLKGWVK